MILGKRNIAGLPTLRNSEARGPSVRTGRKVLRSSSPIPTPRWGVGDGQRTMTFSRDPSGDWRHCHLGLEGPGIF